ncbi:hypothetical protein GDO86_016226 [Hymenochirus boettgeri]|uniref:Uncharacterized protein n=1 Tax=Hymenochirus boettgeri TaxID=247094 RepID=A0A8T2K4F1_9PIPI|nr:hypothetical protein GDO86_016226 [Hymenochirus boettgeri]
MVGFIKHKLWLPYYCTIIYGDLNIHISLLVWSTVECTSTRFIHLSILVLLRVGTRGLNTIYDSFLLKLLCLLKYKWAFC